LFTWALHWHFLVSLSLPARWRRWWRDLGQNEVNKPSRLPRGSRSRVWTSMPEDKLQGLQRLHLGSRHRDGKGPEQGATASTVPSFGVYEVAEPLFLRCHRGEAGYCHFPFSAALCSVCATSPSSFAKINPKFCHSSFAMRPFSIRQAR